MKTILFSIALFVFAPAHIGNSTVSKERKPDSKKIKEDIDEAVHRIPIDAANRQVNRDLFAVQSRRIDSMELVINNRTHKR